MLETLIVEIRYAIRQLLKRPIYSLAVVLVLSLGIGTNLITFGLFQSLALTPLAGVPRSADLQFVMARTSGGRDVALSYPDYEYVRDHARAYEKLAGSFLQGWMLGRGAKATRVFGEFVTSNYFDVLGTRMQSGRPFSASEDVRGGSSVAVISDALWRRRFAAAPDIVGRTIELDAARLTIVGVASPDFHGSIPGVATDIFIPYAAQGELYGGNDRLNDPQAHWVFAFGRLRSGVSAAQTQAEADVLSSELGRERPLEGVSQRLVVMPIWRSPQGAQTFMLPAVTLMGAMSALLLLVVCANVAGLVLVRGLARSGEITARLALGATRGGIVRLLLLDTLVLAVPGALAGYWLPSLIKPFLVSIQPSTIDLPLFFNVEGALKVSATVVLTCAAALLAGVAPALTASRVDLSSPMKDMSGRGAANGRTRTALVVAQVALSVLLLVGTALGARSLSQARRADPGFDRNVASVQIDLLPAGYDEPRAKVFYRQLLDKLRADPAIEAATVMKDPLLMLMEFNAQEFVPEGYARGRDEDLSFLFNVVGTDHFRTLRIPLLAGRDFRDEDDASAPHTAIVNETMAKRFWGSAAAAIGKRLRTRTWGQTTTEWRTIVGVVRDIKYARLTEEPRPYVYLPHSEAFNYMMDVQARGDGAAIVENVRQHIRDLDPDLPILQAAMLSEITSLGTGVYDLTARTLGIVSTVSMALMALGVFGLIAFSVQQSTRHIGIRLAIGATRTHILLRYLRRGLKLGLVGTACGVAATLALTQFAAGLLYGVTATDAISFVSAAAAVLATAVAAAAFPAWRASRVDPLVALRHQ